jgi:2-methylcitrate dehydratase
MQVRENPGFTADYYDPDRRHIGNALQIVYDDGTASERVAVDYPIGHRKRRAEGMPVLVKKFHSSVAAHFSEPQADVIRALFADRPRLESLTVDVFMSTLATGVAAP